MTKPSLSVVVGTYNRLEQLKRLIDSVARETRTPFRLYVTDAGSTDGTIDYLRSQASEWLRPVFVGRKLGQARAYNDVFLMCDTPYVCWVSDDNEIVNGGLDTAVRILESDHRIGMVGLKVRDKEGPFVKASYIGGISTLGILNVNQGVLPRAVLQSVGGFSEEFRDYGIDPDLTAKVLFLGFDVVYTREIAIHHYRNWSMDETSEEHKALKAKLARALELYERNYASLKEPSATLDLKRKLWEAAKKHLSNRFDLSLNSHKLIFGNVARDYYNALHARFINPFDPLLTRGKAYHLRQQGRKAARRGSPAGALQTVGS